ncbi:MAG: hypothetical protein K9L86_05315 [Candidatus Omnitrophica bacterium]|nr:hypothetical protein [Candidatus Omnitrophota bacterium]
MRKFFNLLLIFTFISINSFAQIGISPIGLSFKSCNDIILKPILLKPYYVPLPDFSSNKDWVQPLIYDLETKTATKSYDKKFLIKAYDLFMAENDYSMARSSALKMLEIDKRDAEVLNLIGDTFLAEKDLSKALDYYLQAEKINTRLLNVHNSIGSVYMEIDKNYQVAQKEFELEILHNPTNWMPYHNIALIHRYNNNNEEAFQAYARSVEVADNELEPMLIVARFCEQLQVHPEEGKKIIKKALFLYPNSWRAWEINAGFHYRDGEYEKAEKDYLYSLKLYPRSTTLYELSWTYTRMGKLYLAEATYKKAVAMGANDDTCYRDSAKELLGEKGIVVN